MSSVHTGHTPTAGATTILPPPFALPLPPPNLYDHLCRFCDQYVPHVGVCRTLQDWDALRALHHVFFSSLSLLMVLTCAAKPPSTRAAI